MNSYGTLGNRAELRELMRILNQSVEEIEEALAREKEIDSEFDRDKIMRFVDTLLIPEGQKYHFVGCVIQQGLRSELILSDATLASDNFYPLILPGYYPGIREQLIKTISGFKGADRNGDFVISVWRKNEPDSEEVLIEDEDGKVTGGLVQQPIKDDWHVEVSGASKQREEYVDAYSSQVCVHVGLDHWQKMEKNKGPILDAVLEQCVKVDKFTKETHDILLPYAIGLLQVCLDDLDLLTDNRIELLQNFLIPKFSGVDDNDLQELWGNIQQALHDGEFVHQQKAKRVHQQEVKRARQQHEHDKKFGLTVLPSS